MRMTRSLPVCAVLLPVCCLALAAQVMVSVRGRVATVSGAAVGGATVTLERGGQPVQSSTSDESGAYEFPSVEPGEYALRVVAPGFVTAVRPITPIPGATQTFNVTIRASARPSRGSPPDTALPSPGLTTAGGPSAGPAPTHARVTVFYATDRDRTRASPVSYGSGRNAAGQLQLGTTTVRIPRDHRIGVVERPTIWTLWREDADRHFVIEGIRELSRDVFYAQMRATIARSTGRQAFVFVHGFNVTFESAVYRTAQMAYDLSFDGAPILYSWPSEGALLKYAADLNNNDWTVEHLRTFLDELSAQSGARTVHLIAHSMGNRALLHALAGLAGRGAPGPRFNQLALTAPDIDADEFRQLSAAIRPLITRATLYASSNDLALLASSAYQGYQRAGDTRPSVVVVDEIDTVDVSAVDSNLIGHFYYGDNRSVISDLFYVLQGRPAGGRATLRPEMAGARQYWVFRP
jgi:esterase/lipase superfamily enzyme